MGLIKNAVGVSLILLIIGAVACSQPVQVIGPQSGSPLVTVTTSPLPPAQPLKGSLGLLLDNGTQNELINSTSWPGTWYGVVLTFTYQASPTSNSISVSDSWNNFKVEPGAYIAFAPYNFTDIKGHQFVAQGVNAWPEGSYVFSAIAIDSDSNWQKVSLSVSPDGMGIGHTVTVG